VIVEIDGNAYRVEGILADDNGTVYLLEPAEMERLVSAICDGDNLRASIAGTEKPVRMEAPLEVIVQQLDASCAERYPEAFGKRRLRGSPVRLSRSLP